MHVWASLLDVLILLSAALLLGGLCERLRQNAILGYLLAGTLLGPHAFDLLPHREPLLDLAELGVVLLMFTIGLEFSLRRLLRMGATALGGGTLQVAATVLIFAIPAFLLGVNLSASVAIGSMIALSSTACVLRLLARRAELDSVHGRNALGILLMQDIAVVPLILLVTILASGGGPGEAAIGLLEALLSAILLVLGLYALLYAIMPKLLGMQTIRRNRELPILLAIAAALGSAWATHEMGLSPALGAFVAGILLAESPFAVQIRADVGSLRTLFVTLFFAAIGTLGDPAWAAANAPLLIGVVLAIVIGKTTVTAAAVRLFRVPWHQALATGLCLAQVGEFSFVLAKLAYADGQGPLNESLFKLMVSATILTLFVTPFLVNYALPTGHALTRHFIRTTKTPTQRRTSQRQTPQPDTPAQHNDDQNQNKQTDDTQHDTKRDAQHDSQPQSADQPPPPKTAPKDQPPPDHHAAPRIIIIVGFGPAAQRIAGSLAPAYRENVRVIDLNPDSIAAARRYDLEAVIGDACHDEVLEHAGVHDACAVIVTVPDPAAVRAVTQRVRTLAPKARVLARARYHVYRWELMLAGAQVVVDEEELVGQRMASELARILDQQPD